MKHKQSSGTRPVHQTVAGEFEFKTAGKSIAIGFTDQRLSPHAGSAVFWSWLRGGPWVKTLSEVLPQVLPASNNYLLPIEKALAFIHGLLCDARKLTHVAYLRRDPANGCWMCPATVFKRWSPVCQRPHMRRWQCGAITTAGPIART